MHKRKTHIKQDNTFCFLFGWQKFCIQSNTTNTKYKLANKRNFHFTYDCGVQPMAKPTRPLKSSNQIKLGAKELKNPYQNNKTAHNERACKR